MFIIQSTYQQEDSSWPDGCSRFYGPFSTEDSARSFADPLIKQYPAWSFSFHELMDLEEIQQRLW